MIRQIAPAQLLMNIGSVNVTYALSSNMNAKPTKINLNIHAAREPLSSIVTGNITSAPSTSSHPKRSMHLISLPAKDDLFSQPAESLVRECWKWKDSVLGDGRDYFVPRPKSLKAFHSLFVGMGICVEVDLVQMDGVMDCSLTRVILELMPKNNRQLEIPLVLVQPSSLKQNRIANKVTKSYVIEECVALSNCARFEVLLVLKETNRQLTAATENMSKIAESAARLSVAYHLWRQTQKHQTKRGSLLQRSGISNWLDLPDAIDTNIDRSTDMPLPDQSKAILQLANRFTILEGAHPISSHLSLIASGLAPRTNRPDREVIFRPYSSRDAHILLQLKRTAEVISMLDGEQDHGGQGRLKTLLDGALTAGKAARNEKIVPNIIQLKEFGSDGTPPISIANIVAEVFMY